MTFTVEQRAELEGPLDRAKVKTRDQGGKTLSYVEAWHAIAEANRIFGFDAWARETVMLTETNRELVTLKTREGGTYEQWRVGYLAKVRITAGGVVREGTGFGSGMAKPEALGDAIESAAKEAESDAMKRALMTFGNPFGLALYDKTQENVVASPPKRSQPLMVAINTMEGYQRDTAAFREFWEKNKAGFKANFSPDEYAEVVGAMRRIAASMPKPEAAPETPPGEPATRTHLRNGTPVPDGVRSARELISQDEIPF
jgi:DNA repair and recombination protein RAD52